MKRYFWDVPLGLDQFLSVLTSGDSDETVSGRVGKMAAAGSRIGHLLEIGRSCIGVELLPECAII